jgi:tetratricopeptide (TPR) repeat protein
MGLAFCFHCGLTYAEDATSVPDTSLSSSNTLSASWATACQLKRENRFVAALQATQNILQSVRHQPDTSPLLTMQLYSQVIELAQQVSQPQLVRQVEKQRLAWAKALSPSWVQAAVPPSLKPADAYLAKADLAYQLDKPEPEALVWLIKATEVDANIHTLGKLAGHYLHYGQAELAEKVFQQALLCPDSLPYEKASLLTQYGYMLYSLGRLDDATRHLKQALAYQGVLPLGLTFMQAEYLLRAIQKIPADKPDYLSELGDVPQKPGEPYKAKRWHDKTRVIRVLISDGSAVPGWQPQYATWIPWALESWNVPLGNRFQFVYSQDAGQPYDLAIVWKPRSDPQGFFNLKNMPPWLVNTHQLETLGQNKIMEMGNFYVQNQLDIFLTSSVGHSRADRQMKSVILHEIGHSFGLTGHSRYPGDVMFESSSGVDRITLSNRDINSIKRLYAEKASITNEPSQPVSTYGRRVAKDFNVDWAVND